VIVLDKLSTNTKVHVLAPAVGFEEETAAIPVNLRLDHNHSPERSM
jgi:hypothetical protein